MKKFQPSGPIEYSLHSCVDGETFYFNFFAYLLLSFCLRLNYTTYKNRSNLILGSQVRKYNCFVDNQDS